MDLITANVVQPTQEMLDWAVAGDDNYFDPEVLSYPTTRTLLLHTDTKNILYMPVQRVMMLESLAINPKAEKHEVAASIRTAITSLILSAQNDGIGELYFLGTNEKTNEFARRHNLEEMKWKVFRKKVFPLRQTNEGL
jgi:hypothetical protein